MPAALLLKNMAYLSFWFLFAVENQPAHSKRKISLVGGTTRKLANIRTK
jgi:hypothetical protein